MSRNVRPRVLIMGACEGVGRACADALGERGAELILCDYDGPALHQLSEALGAVGRFCDIMSETSVNIFAADIIERFQTLDVLINAAGSGYERTLGMYRVSRALLPALKKNEGRAFIFNVPPPAHEATIFPYASSRQAYWRLCEALAVETRGSPASVRIACPQRLQIGTIQAAADVEEPFDPGSVDSSLPDNAAALATRIASLVYFSDRADRRKTIPYSPVGRRSARRV